MARFVTSELQNAISEAEPGSEIEIVIVPSDESEDDVYRRVEEFDVKIERELPSGVLLVTSPTNVVSDFMSTSAIASVSLPDRMEIMQ